MLFFLSLITLAISSKNYCDDKHYCSETQTCCLQPNNKYGCCPFATAVCCVDRQHCCPADLPICNSNTGKCSANNGFTSMWGTRVSAALIVPTEFDGKSEWGACLNSISSCQTSMDLMTWSLHMVACLGSEKYEKACEASKDCFKMREDGRTFDCEETGAVVETSLIKEEQEIKETIVENGPVLGIGLSFEAPFAIIGWSNVGEDSFWIAIKETGIEFQVKYQDLYVVDAGKLLKEIN